MFALELGRMWRRLRRAMSGEKSLDSGGLFLLDILFLFYESDFRDRPGARPSRAETSDATKSLKVTRRPASHKFFLCILLRPKITEALCRRPASSLLPISRSRCDGLWQPCFQRSQLNSSTTPPVWSPPSRVPVTLFAMFFSHRPAVRQPPPTGPE